MNQPKFSFFGTPEFSVHTLDVLESHGLSPDVVITAPDRPRGRGQKLTPTPVKIWAEKRGIPVLTPETLRKNEEFQKELATFDLDYNIVAAYGLIIPDEILSTPNFGSINVHPSLLPKYRGASPIEFQVLADEENIGVTIMLMDAEMDHGPILAQTEIKRPRMIPDAVELEKALVLIGGELLAETLIAHFEGKISAEPQNHSLATFTKKITKEDAKIDFALDPFENFLRIQAFKRFRPYFFARKNEKEIRVIITQASFDEKNHALVIERVIPEGGGEIDFKSFLETAEII